MNNNWLYSVWCRIKNFIGSIGWRVFLWSEGIREERYWEIIYEQEKRLIKDITESDMNTVEEGK